MSTLARQRIRDYLLAEREAQMRFLTEIVKVPSDNPPGDCRPHAERTARLLADLGLESEQHPVPAAELEANGLVSCMNLVVRRRFGDGGPTIALSAHGDAVPPGLGWSADPYGAEVRAGRMYGRGVAVSKSDFATYTWALLALEQSGAHLSGTVELHFTYDEESGGAFGPKWLLERGISKPDCAISAGFSYGVITAHNGCVHLEVEVLGQSGHAAEPHKAHDALEAATVILHALYAYRKSLCELQSSIPGISSPTLVVGLISGGINTNVVPDRIVMRLDRRIIPDEEGRAAEQSVRDVIEQSIRGVPGIRVRIRRTLFAEPFRPSAAQSRLIEPLSRNACDVFGVDVKPSGVPIYTDARHYGAAGIPTVLYGAGPRTLEEANGHRADENLVLDDLYKATEVVALTLHDLLAATD